MALPDFFVAGAPKAGTTAVHVALARHPSLYMSAVKEPKFFLTDGPPPTRGGPGDVQTYREHVWRRDDYEALFDLGARRGPARRVHAVLPVQPGRAAPYPRAGAGRQADRDPAGPGGAGPFELDPPVVGRPRPGRRLRAGLRRGGTPDRGGLGRLLALHRARPLRGAAGAPLLGVPRGSGLRLPLPRPGRAARPGCWTGSARSSACRRASSARCRGRTSRPTRSDRSGTAAWPRFCAVRRGGWRPAAARAG